MLRGVLLGGLLGLTIAHGSAAAPDAADAERLIASRRDEGYQRPVQGSSVQVGGARVAVEAPVSVVRAVVTDYAHYADFLPEFRKSRVIGRTSKGTDVYLEVPILHGAAKFWAVARFTGPTAEALGERIEGRREAQGNIETFEATWHYYAPDPNHTILELELLLLPKLPVPAGIMNGELSRASSRAVLATRNRAEAIANAVGRGTN